jgi:hypothetical protein
MTDGIGKDSEPYLLRAVVANSLLFSVYVIPLLVACAVDPKSSRRIGS